MKFISESRLITSLKDKYLMKEWISSNIASSRLLMRASESGFKREAFQSLCGGKGPMLIIIKSTDSFVFGGFAY
jgi:hypothetical protein